MNKYTIEMDNGNRIEVQSHGFVVERGALTFHESYEKAGIELKTGMPFLTINALKITAFNASPLTGRDTTFEFGWDDIFK